MIPYLKMNMKIHKLSGVQLKSCEPSSAKYRPIQDSVGSLLKPYSRICMELLRKLNKTVKEKHIRVSKIETINGAEVSSEIENLKTETRSYKF